MAKSRAKSDDPTLETLRTLLIVQLAQSGIGNEDIRKIVGVAKERVNEVCKYVRKGVRSKKG